jgi:CYTH domain-containing protein
MPTEHEYKYVLDLGIRKDVIKSVPIKQNIEQGYLAFSKGMTCRVRKINNSGKGTEYFFTFKQKVDGRVVEIETSLNQRDGKDLWNSCISKLRKDRHKLVDGKNTWDIDLFYNESDFCYFILAEVELPEGADRPKKLPDLLKKKVIYEVPLTDDRFSNKRLGDAFYAMDLYKKLNGGD